MLTFTGRQPLFKIVNEKGISKFQTDKRTEETKTTAVKINVYHLGKPVGWKGQPR